MTPKVLSKSALGTRRSIATSSGVSNNMLILCILIGSFILSVDAIKCHQCNSHKEPNCAALNIPKAVKQDEYLKDCDGLYDGSTPFCRKTVVTFEHTEETRIVRSCGWVNTAKRVIDRCLNADNEGYLENICTCFSDGCNSAPPGIRRFSLVSIVVVVFLSLLIRCF